MDFEICNYFGTICYTAGWVEWVEFERGKRNRDWQMSGWGEAGAEVVSGLGVVC